MVFNGNCYYESVICQTGHLGNQYIQWSIIQSVVWSHSVLTAEKCFICGVSCQSAPCPSLVLILLVMFCSNIQQAEFCIDKEPVTEEKNPLKSWLLFVFMNFVRCESEGWNFVGRVNPSDGQSAGLFVQLSLCDVQESFLQTILRQLTTVLENVIRAHQVIPLLPLPPPPPRPDCPPSTR